MSSVNELPAPLKALFGDATGPVSPEHITKVLTQYGERMSAGDADGVVALFAPDAVIYDPVGTPPRSGDALRQFYQGSFDFSGGFIEMRLDGDVRVSGSHGAAAYIARMTMAGSHVLVKTLDVMKFNEDGLIASMHAYWGPSTIELSTRPPEKLG